MNKIQKQKSKQYRPEFSSLSASFNRAEEVIPEVYRKYCEKRCKLEYEIVMSKIDSMSKLKLLQSDLFKFKDADKMGRDMMVVLTFVATNGKRHQEYLEAFKQASYQLRLDTCAFSVAYSKTKKQFDELVAKQQITQKTR